MTAAGVNESPAAAAAPRAEVSGIRHSPGSAGLAAGAGRLSRRCFDICVAGVALALVSPIMLLAALAICVMMGRPILFRQQRPGLNGRLFELLKFRTMRPADDRTDGGSVVAGDTEADGDAARLTSLGRMLRRASVDELPQLWNVLRGDMSLVGPRPLLPEYLPLYSARQARRHEVLPGLTGWAQVSGRNALSWPEKLELDVWYVEHRSVILDLRILGRSVAAVLGGRGISEAGQATATRFEGNGMQEGIAETEQAAANRIVGNRTDPVETNGPGGTRRKERLYLSPPMLGGREQEFVADALASNWIAPLGPHVDAFEREMADLTGAKHAVALSSGTAAVHLALRILDVGPGDEVLASSLTFIGSVSPIRYLGARPTFVDCDAGCWNIDPALVAGVLEERAATGRLPRAVVVAHLYGQSADMAALREICDRYGVPVVEDAAEALGGACHGRPLGNLGAVGAFSFNGNKIVTTSGGGMLVTDDDALARRARKLATQAREPAAHYEHVELGYNYRLSNVLAAIGRAQLLELPARVEARRRIFERYRAALGGVPGIAFMPEAPWARHTRWLTTLTVQPEAFGAGRDDIIRELEARNIEARPLWKPMHLQPVFAGADVIGGAVSESLFRTGLCLPSGSAMTAADVDEVAGAILALAQR